MRQPHVDDVVRLTTDIPELLLFRGELGVVRSTWFSPSLAYEVEFRQQDPLNLTRALLSEAQMQLENAGADPAKQ